MLPHNSNLSPEMSLLIIAFGISIYLFNGMIIYRFIVMRLLKADRYLNEAEIIFPGFILGILLNGILGQYLAICHLFSFQIFILVFIFNLLVFRWEAIATLRYLISVPQRYCRLIKHGDVLQAALWCCFLSYVIITFFKIQMPTTYVDVYLFHIPIMESIVHHAGFVYPTIISSYFYGSQPSFIELLFAQGLVLNGNYTMVSALHYTIFVAFLISLLSFAPKKYRWVALLALIFIFSGFDFLSFALSGMTDTARACFAVLGLVFLATYCQRKVTYFLVFSALLIGAALASKYVEVFSLFLAVVTWSFLVVTGRDNLKRMTLFFSLVFMVAGFWYLKNLVVWGNPIYPFVFGHPGFSDGDWAKFMGKLTVSYDPAYRHYSRAIFSIRGWVDCLKVNSQLFLPEKTGQPFLATATFFSLLAVNTILRPKYKGLAILAGLTYLLGMILFGTLNPFSPASFMIGTLIVCILLGDNKTSLLTAAALLYLSGYYFFVFHMARYAMTGQLLLYTAFYLALMTVIENLEETPLFTRITARLKGLEPHMYRASVFLLSAYLALFLCRALRVNPIGSLDLEVTPQGSLGCSNREVVLATFTDGGMQRFLSKHYPFYGLYSFVVQNKLRNVLNPLEFGAPFYVKYIIPGSKPDDTFLHYSVMPPSLAALDDFLKEHQIKYFVRKIDLHTDQVVSETFGTAHVALVNSMYEKLFPRSTRIYADQYGYELFQIIN